MEDLIKNVNNFKTLDEAIDLISDSETIRIDFKDLSVKQQTKYYHMNLINKMINGYGFEARGKYLEELKSIRTFYEQKMTLSVIKSVNYIRRFNSFTIKHVRTLETITTFEEQIKRIKDINLKLIQGEQLYKHGIFDFLYKIYERHD